MLVTYDREVDALAIDLVENARRARTERLEGGVLLHRDRDGRMIELEILGASTRYPLEELEQIGSPAEWLTLQEAAKESGLAVSTLKNQIHNDRLAAQKRGHDWLISRAALWTYLESREARGRPAKKPKARRVKRSTTR